MFRFRKTDAFTNLVTYFLCSLYLPSHLSVKVNNLMDLIYAYLMGLLTMMRTKSIIASSNSFIGAHLRKSSLVRSIGGSFFFVRKQTEDLQYVSPLSEIRELRIMKRCIVKTKRFLKINSIPFTIVFIDVGAHIGKYAVQIAKLVDKVIAIEPDPYNFAVLKLNISLNNLRNIMPVQMAASCRECVLLFVSHVASTAHSHVSRILRNDLYKDHIRKLYVHSRSVDSLLSELGLLNNNSLFFVKIDVEGYEKDVLLGMKETLGYSKCLMIETRYENIADILGLLPKSFRLLHSFKYPTTLNLVLENPNLTTT